MVGILSFAHVTGLKDEGSAVPVCEPVMRNAGPGPALMILAAPLEPSMPMGPLAVVLMLMVLVMRYLPRGRRMRPSPSLTACWIALVSSALPSPMAPKFLILLMEGIVRDRGGEGVGLRFSDGDSIGIGLAAGADVETYGDFLVG